MWKITCADPPPPAGLIQPKRTTILSTMRRFLRWRRWPLSKVTDTEVFQVSGSIERYETLTSKTQDPRSLYIQPLCDLPGAPLVKALPVNPTDPSVTGPDLFAKLVPMAAHEASSLYRYAPGSSVGEADSRWTDCSFHVGSFQRGESKAAERCHGQD